MSASPATPTDNDVPENANESCPGTMSESAGRSKACEGCPNQAACASAVRKPDPALVEIRDRMATVKHKILVLSGKGGVGKSTLAAQLSFALAAHQLQVGLLDIDICGPSIPHLLGLTGEQVHQSGLGWSPVYLEDNLGVMSIGFMLPNRDDPVIWRGPRKNGLIKQFMKDVFWGEIDYLLVDTPPGTSDEHLSIVEFLKATTFDGAIIVTTPQEIALSDVRKEINFCKKVGMRVLGVVENMSGFVCPHCNCETTIFHPSSGGAERMARDFNVPFLGRIPLDAELAKACEMGCSYLQDNRDRPGVRALGEIVSQLMTEAEKMERIENQNA